VFQDLKILDLGRQLAPGMPTSPSHPDFVHSVQRRHGDKIRADGGSGSSDLLVLGAHVGTHIDALSHASHDGLLFGGVSTSEVMEGGSFKTLGADEIEPFIRPCVVLDIATFMGVECLEGGFEISASLLESCAEHQQTTINSGAVVFIRTGWGTKYGDPDAYIGHESGVPGIGEEGAKWLAERNVHCVGADTIAFERIEPGKGHYKLPAHRVLLVESGIYIIEALNLEPVKETAIYCFDVVVSPLNIKGGTGAPVRPLALIQTN